MHVPFTPKKADELFDQLPSFAAARLREISEMSQPYIDATDKYARLNSRVITLLGQIAPVTTQDVVIRDLTADVFDFLYEARDLIIGGKIPIAYPLARRAYESLSLLALCALDVDWAEKWHNGKKVSNGEVRKHLSKHPMGESETDLKALYDFFCVATHPNRDLVASRRLGEGNEFVLGMIGMPDLYLVVDYCSKHIDLWHWLTGVVTYFYREWLSEHDRSYYSAYKTTITEGQRTKKWLVENMPRLKAESLAIDANDGWMPVDGKFQTL
jgi:hypothetical protein